MLTKTKFWLGLFLIAGSLIMGKAVIPLFFSPETKMLGLWLYIISWPILFVGIYFCGYEGYNLIHELSREYTRRALERSKVDKVAHALNEQRRKAYNRAKQTRVATASKNAVTKMRERIPRNKFPHKRS